MIEDSELEVVLAFLNSEFDKDSLILDTDYELEDSVRQERGSLPLNARVPRPRKPREKTIKHNRARDERVVELQRLRHEVEDLEFTLERLQTIRRRDGSGSEQNDDFDNKSGESVWRNVCARQLERRLRVERENMHLVKNLEKDKQFMKRLENLLSMRPALWNMVCPEPRKCLRRIDIPPGSVKNMADLIFQELSVGVELLYQSVENLDEVISPLLTNLSSREPLLRGGNSGRRAEAFSCTVVPFGMTETGDAWWRYWNDQRGQVVQDSTGNVVTESFGYEIIDVSTNTSATFYVQQVLRRHVENHRIVFVWTGYFEPFVFKGKRMRGVYYREQSYVLIKPGNIEGGITTSVSSCEFVSHYFLEPTLRKDATVTALTKLVMSSMSSDILTWNETIESLLLDQAMQK